jgi:hypothetical protein
MSARGVINGGGVSIMAMAAMGVVMAMANQAMANGGNINNERNSSWRGWQRNAETSANIIISGSGEISSAAAKMAAAWQRGGSGGVSAKYGGAAK